MRRGRMSGLVWEPAWRAAACGVKGSVEGGVWGAARRAASVGPVLGAVWVEGSIEGTAGSIDHAGMEDGWRRRGQRDGFVKGSVVGGVNSYRSRETKAVPCLASYCKPGAQTRGHSTEGVVS